MTSALPSQVSRLELLPKRKSYSEPSIHCRPPEQVYTGLPSSSQGMWMEAWTREGTEDGMPGQ